MDEIKNKIAKLEIENGIIKERIEQYQQQNIIKITSYRNYAIIIFTLISFMGIGAFRYVVEGVSSKAAQEAAAKGVNAILNKDYISKEIQDKSKIALQGIISEAESRAKELVSLGYSFNRHIDMGNYIGYIDHQKALEEYEEAFKIWQSFSSSFPKQESCYFLTTYIEIQTINRKYDKAFTNCNLANKYASRPEEKALILLYEILILRFTNKDYSDSLSQYDILLGNIDNNAYIPWSFDLFMSYIKNKENNFKEDDIKFAVSLSDKIKHKIHIIN